LNKNKVYCLILKLQYLKLTPYIRFDNILHCTQKIKTYILYVILIHVSVSLARKIYTRAGYY